MTSQTTVPAPNPEITGAEILAHIKTLASDETEGRFPGTAGSYIARDYIIESWRASGILPAPGLPGYLQPFDLITEVTVDDQTALTINGAALNLDSDYTPFAFSGEGAADGSAVFAGFGLVFEGDSTSWNDYANIDPTGRWVLMVEGRPDSVDLPNPSVGSLPHRVITAREKGAVGVIIISAPDSDPQLYSLRYNRGFHNAEIPVLNLTADAATKILSAQFWFQFESGQWPNSSLDELTITAEVALTHHIGEAANVVGYIAGTDPTLKDEYIVVGGHFDHLGYGGPESGSMTADLHAIHNGADDNASGVSAMLEIAQKLAANRDEMKRSVILIAFDGEEQGLLGSKYFVEHSPVPLENIALMINLDMIGRIRENRLLIGGTGTAPILDRVLPEFNRSYQFDLTLSSQGPGPSDHSSFYNKDIPVLFFFTSAHEDYHKPSDDWEKIDTTGVQRIASFAFDVAQYFNQREQRPQFTESGASSDLPSRRSFKVTFGIIPGYGSSASGLAIDGVKDGGPAQNAGIIKDDVIVGIGGKPIKNIQDYMYRLNELNPGDAVEVEIERDGERIKIQVQL